MIDAWMLMKASSKTKKELYNRYSSTNKMCDPLETSAKEKHCLENGPADWFIVLDVSWFNESNKLQNLATTKSTFEKQTFLVDQLINFLSKTETARPRKNR
uniref:Uncharacterized protein n=1 Tax=Romanomermis culicivorax TaxID=13658 RepID=A0A915KL96_ROMCU